MVTCFLNIDRGLCKDIPLNQIDGEEVVDRIGFAFSRLGRGADHPLPPS